MCHENDKCKHTLHWHSVIERGTAATDRTVTLQLDEVRLCCLSDELGLKRIIAADAEGHVDLGAILLFHVVLVVSFSAINVIVKKAGALLCPCLHRGYATLLKHVCHVEPAHVDWEAGGGVVEGILCLLERLPFTEQWGVASVTSDQIVSNHHNCDASRSNVLLRASVHHTELAPVDMACCDVRRHVADQGLALRNQMEGKIVAELKALDRLITAVVEESCIAIDVPL